jgi:nitrite reductase (NADH) small subunit
VPFVTIATLDQLSRGAPHPFRVAGKDLVLCRIDDQVYAVDGVCPHVGAPLGHGTLQGCMLICPWHAWEFDCITGEHDRNRACRLVTYAVKLDQGAVLVDLPDA